MRKLSAYAIIIFFLLKVGESLLHFMVESLILFLPSKFFLGAVRRGADIYTRLFIGHHHFRVKYMVRKTPPFFTQPFFKRFFPPAVKMAAASTVSSTHVLLLLSLQTRPTLSAQDQAYGDELYMQHGMAEQYLNIW